MYDVTARKIVDKAISTFNDIRRGIESHGINLNNVSPLEYGNIIRNQLTRWSDISDTVIPLGSLNVGDIIQIPFVAPSPHIRAYRIIQKGTPTTPTQIFNEGWTYQGFDNTVTVQQIHRLETGIARSNVIYLNSTLETWLRNTFSTWVHPSICNMAIEAEWPTQTIISTNPPASHAHTVFRMPFKAVVLNHVELGFPTTTTSMMHIGSPFTFWVGAPSRVYTDFAGTASRWHNRSTGNSPNLVPSIETNGTINQAQPTLWTAHGTIMGVRPVMVFPENARVSVGGRVLIAD